MKITHLQALYPRYQHVKSSWRTHFWQIAVRVETDAGLVGWGYGGGGVAAVEIVNRHFRPLLVGRALDGVAAIEDLWDKLYLASAPYGRRGLAIMALSGVDLALWDLWGRATRRSVCELLGGPRHARIRAYATGGDLSRHRDQGFSAYKLPYQFGGVEQGPDELVRWAEGARPALGAEGLLMIDGYMSWGPEQARRAAAALAPYDIYWFEDLLLPDQVEAQAALRPQIKPVLLAGGEHEFTHYGFAELARAQALDLWQPDVTWCGGLTAARRIVELAREHQIPVVFHRGGEVWGLHLIAAGFGDPLAELVLGDHQAPKDQVWLDEPQAQDGYLSAPQEPGFGVRVNRDML